MSECTVFPNSEQYKLRASATKEENKKAEQARKDKEKKKKQMKRKSIDSSQQGGNPPKKQRGRPAKESVISFESSFELPITLKIVLQEDQLQINNITYSAASSCSANDVESLTRGRKLHDLPSSISVSRILKQFVKESVKKQDKDDKKEVTSQNSQSLETTKKKYKKFASDICDLFDVILPKFLLYSNEWYQYTYLCCDKVKIDAGEDSPSNFYSGEFLLRLIACLPVLFSSMKEFTNENPNITGSKDNIFSIWREKFDLESDDFALMIYQLIVFLQKNCSKIFKGKYRSPNPSEYTSREKDEEKRQTKE